MSRKFLIWIILNFVIMGLLCLREKRYPWALYWAGAVLLNVGVLWGMK